MLPYTVRHASRSGDRTLLSKAKHATGLKGDWVNPLGQARKPLGLTADNLCVRLARPPRAHAGWEPEQAFRPVPMVPVRTLVRAGVSELTRSLRSLWAPSQGGLSQPKGRNGAGGTGPGNCVTLERRTLFTRSLSRS